nr:phosphatase PAP2 family protein [Bacteroidota bacterium]
MKGFQLILFLIFLSISSYLPAQTLSRPGDTNYLKLNKPYIFSYAADARDVAVAPFKWDKKQWIGFAIFAGASALTYSLDDQIRDVFQGNQSDGINQLTNYVLDPLGAYYLIPILGSLYLYGLAAHNPDAETAALLTGKAAAITGAYTFLFKNVFQRRRPWQGNSPDPGFWGGPFNGFQYNSFPSGHTALAFSVATVLGSYYHKKIWVGITSYSLATLVGISRIYDDEHWASDVLAGAVLGFAIGKLVYNKHERTPKTSFSLYKEGAFSGLSMRWNIN